MISLDGSQGGGQLLRTALSLSAATGQAFEIKNIRGQRAKGGLQPQHLAAVHAVQQLCGAQVEGDRRGSTSLRFEPGTIKGGKYTFDIGTAGSTTLLLQTLIPACLREEKESIFIVKGGTDTLWCPPSHYFLHVFCRFLHAMGLTVHADIKRYGFYPKGGGEVSFTMDAHQQLGDIHFVERGALQTIDVCALVSKDLMQRQVGERMLKGFQTVFPDKMVRYDVHPVDTLSPGCVLHSHAHYEHFAVGADVLGEQKKKAEDVGKECALQLQRVMKSEGVDAYAADQLMIYLGLKGEGTIATDKITDHMTTNAQIIEQFLPVRFSMKKNVIMCRKV